MMKASLDTNIIIHLYASNCQSILFDVFDEIYVHEFIRKVELEHHGRSVIPSFDHDVNQKKIKIVTADDLRGKGAYSLFSQYFGEEKLLYSPQDMGEIYATALARTLGLIALLTDDIKLYGPHYTLMQVPDSEVVPFSFYEVLFLAYLSNTIDEKQYISLFEKVNHTGELNWRITDKLYKIIDRFKRPINTQHEKKWMEKYCTEHGVRFDQKMRTLINALR